MQIRGRIADFDIRFSEWLGKAPNTGFYIACQTGCCDFLLRRTSLPFLDSEVIGGAIFFAGIGSIRFKGLSNMDWHVMAMIG